MTCALHVRLAALLDCSTLQHSNKDRRWIPPYGGATQLDLVTLGSPGNMNIMNTYLSEELFTKAHGLLIGEHIPQVLAAQKNKVVIILHCKACNLRLGRDDVRRETVGVVLGPRETIGLCNTTQAWTFRSLSTDVELTCCCLNESVYHADIRENTYEI